MQCPKCNINIFENSQFCPNCGVNIYEYNTQKNIDENNQFCKNCGKEIDITARFCGYCGFKQTKEDDIYNSPTTINWGLIIISAICILIIIMPCVQYFAEKSPINSSPKRMGVDSEARYGNKSREYNEYKPVETARIDVVSDRLISQGYGMYEITGVIKNNSNRTCFDPFVDITTYDSGGNIVSQHSPVYISSLSPGESYRFNFPEMNISRYKIRSYGCR